MPIKTILENTHAAVVMNMAPIREGHALVITKRPVVRLIDMTSEEGRDVWDLARAYQKLWNDLPQNKNKKFDYTIYVNDGKDAAQTVPHFHMHVVPIERTNKTRLKRGAIRYAIGKGNGIKYTAHPLPHTAMYKRRARNVSKA